MNSRLITATVAAAALTIPSVAVAKPDPGKRHDTRAAQGHGKGKTVTFVFKGTFSAPGTLEVLSGNAHVRKGGFVGRAVTFDFANAKVVAADTNADQRVNVADVKDGDAVLVQARIGRRTKYAEGVDAIPARKLVDKTNAPDDSSGETEAR
jgi:hypothetical protein